MNTSLIHGQSFERQLTDKVITAINTATNKLFDFYYQCHKWNEKKSELEFYYRDYNNAGSAKKNGRLFFLFILLPILGIIDYASISQFITYLALSSGAGIMSFIISFIGWLFFILLELATGWMLIHYGKEKIVLRIVAVILALGLILLPSYLIFTTYDISPDKTALLYHKTIALIIVSIIIHSILFFVIGEVWAGIYYFVYLLKGKMLDKKHPYKKMKEVIEKLQVSYIDFDKCTANYSAKERNSLLHNRAWYLKHKLTNGAHSQEYDLSDYKPEINYANPLKISVQNETF